MDLESAVIQLQQDVSEINRDVAVIKSDLSNHVRGLTDDVREAREDIRDVREKIERLFGVVMSRQPAGKNGNGWKPVALMAAGWLFALVMFILNFIIERLK